MPAPTPPLQRGADADGRGDGNGESMALAGTGNDSSRSDMTPTQIHPLPVTFDSNFCPHLLRADLICNNQPQRRAQYM